MKTCAACGRPLASHGGQAAIQSSEIGPKAADASCCDPQGTPKPDRSKTAQETTSGAKQRSRARRRKKLGQFFPARITLRPRPNVEQTANAKRPRRRPVLRFRPKRRRAKSQQVVSNPTIEVPSPSEPASNAGDQSLQTLPVEQRTEERKQLIATSTGQFLLWLPIDVISDAGEQPHQVHIIEMQLEQKTAETEPVIAASASSEQLELSLLPKATTDAGADAPSEITSDAPDDSSQSNSPRLEPSRYSSSKRPRKRSKSLQNRRRTLSQTQPTEDKSAEDGGTDTTLFQTQELAFVPWRSTEPMEAILPAAETAARKEQDEPPLGPAVEVCSKPEESHAEPSAPAVADVVDTPAEDPVALETAAPETDVKTPPASVVPDARIEEAGEAPVTLEPKAQAQEPPAPAVEVCNKPKEPCPEPSAPVVALLVDKPADNPTVLETPVEKAAPETDVKTSPAPVVPEVRLEEAGNAPAPLELEQQAQEPPAPVVEVFKPEEPHDQGRTPAVTQSNEKLTEDKPVEKPISRDAPAEQLPCETYGMIPPAPSAPVPGRAEFEARLNAPANPESKESFVEQEAIEVVPGLIADSAAPREPTTEKPTEPVTAKTEEAVEETMPAFSPPAAKETSVPDLTKPGEQEAAADITTQTENSSQQKLTIEPEHETAGGRGGEEANRKLEQPPKKRVLVVDDDPTLRMLLKMGLEPHGYECLLAENGKAAQSLVQANHPALILVDLLMPVMDGLSFVQWLRGTAKDSTPVLVFTNLDDAKITQQALDSGANAFACKPLHLKELLKTMKELVSA